MMHRLTAAARVEATLAIGLALALGLPVVCRQSLRFVPPAPSLGKAPLERLVLLCLFVLGIVALAWWTHRTVRGRFARTATGAVAVMAMTVMIIPAVFPGFVPFLTLFRATAVLGISALPAAIVGACLCFGSRDQADGKS